MFSGMETFGLNTRQCLDCKDSGLESERQSKL